MNTPAARRPKRTPWWLRVGTRWLPFADAASVDLPMGRLLRLSLFQITVGMAMALLNGTLNRVMIVELGVPAWLVAVMVGLPLVFAPLRALMGFRSDHHRSALGWRRVPYIWMGSLLQFGGLAIMPFALLVLSGQGQLAGSQLYGQIGAALAFLLVGAGLHLTQTAGLALATDLAPAASRPRVVALLYVMLLLGMGLSSLAFGVVLADYGHIRLIQVIQAAALLTLLLNVVALWKQEARQPQATRAVPGERRPRLRDAWQRLLSGGRASRLLVATALGTAGFSMQDVLLEPYGGQVLGLSVGATSLLTAVMAAGALCAFGWASRWLRRGGNEHRIASFGCLFGVAGLSAVIFAEPLHTTGLFAAGTFAIGLGGGLFSVATLVAAMGLQSRENNGLALGVWGAVQATAAGLAVAGGGALRDAVSALAQQGLLGSALSTPAVGYSFVYHLEIALLFATLVAVGPLVRRGPSPVTDAREPLGLAELPG